MRHTKQLGYKAHIAFVVFLAIAITLTFNIRMAHPQTDEVKELYEQFAKLSAQGRYSEAIPLAQRALAIYEKSLGPDHPFVASALNHLAAAYKGQGRYADAEPLQKRSLAIYEKSRGPDDLNVATGLA
jgi:tetratricopeptide (TPR) repeat protein